MFPGVKVARCQGNPSPSQDDDQKLAPPLPGQAFLTFGCKSDALGPPSWGTPPDCLDLKPMLRGRAGKAQVVPPSVDLGVLSQEMSPPDEGEMKI